MRSTTRSIALSLLVFAVFGLAVQQVFAAWATRTIVFSGYSWNIKTGVKGPGPNNWTGDASDVYVDNSGALHLAVVRHGDKWYSSEVALPASIGYGTYEFTLGSRIDQLDPNLVFGPFLYRDDTHEMNMEFSQWAGTSNYNSYYTVQPFYLRDTNQRRYFTTLTSASPAKLTMVWTPEHIAFSLSQDGVVLNSFDYKGPHNFEPGHERLRISFWQYESRTPQNDRKNEFVINHFAFTPLK